jgi:hypothetical protein
VRVPRPIPGYSARNPIGITARLTLLHRQFIYVPAPYPWWIQADYGKPGLGEALPDLHSGMWETRLDELYFKSTELRPCMFYARVSLPVEARSQYGGAAVWLAVDMEAVSVGEDMTMTAELWMVRFCNLLDIIFLRYGF